MILKTISPMVLLVCYDDYANLAHTHTRALKSAGVVARCLKLKPHAFQYAEQGEVVTVEQMQYACRTATTIIVYHSSLHVLGIVNNIVSKYNEPCAVVGFHTGTTYREDPAGIRLAFDQRGTELHLTDQCEFLLTDPTLTYLAAAIDIKSIRSSGTFPQIGSTFCIGHYPSKAEVKGTDTIRRLMEAHGNRFRFQYSEERVSHPKQIARMSACDIYLELYQTALAGKPYGCYGVTAFEAAALGRVVMTQNINEQAYIDTYGCRAPFLLCNTEEDFRIHLEHLAGMGPRKLQDMQEDTYLWVNQHHGLQPTGQRLARILSEL